MMECDICKKKERTDEEKKALLNRVNRITGQMNGIKKMIENDAYCPDVLIQLSATYSAIKSLSGIILKEHMKTCVVNGIKNDDMSVIDELANLFQKFQ